MKTICSQTTTGSPELSFRRQHHQVIDNFGIWEKTSRQMATLHVGVMTTFVIIENNPYDINWRKSKDGKLMGGSDRISLLFTLLSDHALWDCKLYMPYQRIKLYGSYIRIAYLDVISYKTIWVMACLLVFAIRATIYTKHIFFRFKF